MSKLRITNFNGLDVRKARESSDPRTARRAVNVNLTLGGEWETRDGLRPIMPLDPQSKGLYAIGGTLRSVIPGGQNKPLTAIGPVYLKYDHLGFGDGTFTSIMIAVDNTNVATLEGGDWPVNMLARNITIEGNAFVVVGQSGRQITLNNPYPGIPGIYVFVLSGAPAFGPRSINMTNGTDVVDIVGGTWPDGIEGSSLSVTTAGFTATILAKLTSTRIRVNTTLSIGSLVNRDFQVSGVAANYPLDTLIRVSAVESIGANAAFGAYPYLVVERWIDAADHARGTVFEHHWIRKDTTDPLVPLLTQIRLPFSPGSDLLKIGGKLAASDDVNGVVRLSSTANGPTDWTTANDAGYIPVITHASGDRHIQGLGVYDDKMAVIFSDAVQLWAMDPQPSNITLVRVINGPGTDQPRSVVNVLGDLFYFTRGGFRSMHMQTVTGQIQEQDDIGGPIDDIAIEETRPAVDAIWSQRRGQYLGFFGTTVYAFKYSPKSKKMGWTTWEFAVEIDSVAEMEGVTYVRANNYLYQLDPTYAAEENFDYELVLNDVTGKDPDVHKRWDFIMVQQSGTSSLRYYLEPDTDEFYLDGPTLTDTTLRIDQVGVGAQSHTLGVRFTGKGPWKLSALQLTYKELDW
jgi:hypothetical protein